MKKEPWKNKKWIEKNKQTFSKEFISIIKKMPKLTFNELNFMRVHAEHLLWIKIPQFEELKSTDLGVCAFRGCAKKSTLKKGALTYCKEHAEEIDRGK